WGGYLVRNHPWSHRLFARRLEWPPCLSHIVAANNGHGPLHMHILDTVEGVLRGKRNQCWHAYQLAIPFNHTYDAYIGCIRCALEGRWQFQHTRILRRGHSFTRDPIFGPMLIADHDFLIHDNKNNVTQFYTDCIDVEICRTNTTWELPLSEEMIIRNQISARDRMTSYDRYIAGVYSMSIGVADIGHC
ncbi:unnamed protein product, partial [Rotaria sp. Silwood2]